jgi:putative endonuclease
MTMPQYDVYIMASRNGVLYIGITSDLVARVRQHKLKVLPGFTAKYNATRLVWHESFVSRNDAIACEKRLKGWRREKKIALIESKNPKWEDLAADLGETQTPRQPEIPQVATAPFGMTYGRQTGF